jgi:hypothetical protein
LHCENASDALSKVRELKCFQRKHHKERKLIVNLQKLVKDCTAQDEYNRLMLSQPSMPDIHFSQGEILQQQIGSTGALNTLKSNRNLVTANSTLDISAAIQKNKGEPAIPKLKEVWRFVKSLLSNYVQV